MAKGLEEKCRFCLRIKKEGWKGFKEGINDLVRKHGVSSKLGRGVGEGFELHAEVKEEDSISLNLSIMTGQTIPYDLIERLRSYVVRNLDSVNRGAVISYDFRESYKTDY